MTSVFYDPANRQMTVAVENLNSTTQMIEEEDGTVIFTFGDVEDIEFYWEEGERLWRAVE